MRCGLSCLVLLAWWLALAHDVAGQVTEPAGRPAAAASATINDDLEALAQLGQLYERALNDNQFDLLASHLHPDFFGVTITNEHVRDIDGIHGYWQRLRGLIGDGGRYTTTVHPEQTVIIGDLALARGTTDDLIVTGHGREYRFTTSWTVVCQREAGEWLVLRAQGTMDPVDNELVQALLRGSTMQGAMSGAVIGLVLGGLAGAYIARRMPRLPTHRAGG